MSIGLRVDYCTAGPSGNPYRVEFATGPTFWRPGRVMRRPAGSAA